MAYGLVFASSGAGLGDCWGCNRGGVRGAKSRAGRRGSPREGVRREGKRAPDRRPHSSNRDPTRRKEGAAPSGHWKESSRARGSTTKGPGAELCLEQMGGRVPAQWCRRGARGHGWRSVVGQSLARAWAARVSPPRWPEGKSRGMRSPCPQGLGWSRWHSLTTVCPVSASRHHGSVPCGVPSSRSGISASTSRGFTRLSPWSETSTAGVRSPGQAVAGARRGVAMGSHSKFQGPRPPDPHPPCSPSPSPLPWPPPGHSPVVAPGT